MRYVAVMEMGPNWEASGKDGSQGATMRAHYDHMKGLFEQGTLILGGPFRGAPGGLNVLEAPTKEAAEGALSADPGVKAGLFTFKMREHFTMFDALAGTCRPFPGG